MAFIATGIKLAVGIGGSLIANNQTKKAAQGIANLPTIDVNKVITEARDAAAKNYATSYELERQYNPQQAALRAEGNFQLDRLAQGDTAGVRARDSLLAGVTGAPNSLLQTSADSILQQLALGGNLSAETQNLVTRTALQGAGAAGILGSNAGRGLVARDLGLTSLDLLRQRQQAGLAAGQALSTDALSRLTAAQNAANADTQRIGTVAALTQSMPLPESGLSPGSIADLYIAQHNEANQNKTTANAIKARSNIDTLNSILGFGSSALGKLSGTKSPSTG